MSHHLTSPSQAVAWTRRRLGCLAVLGLLAPMTAAAALLAEPDASAVRKVVEARLEALAADDAERAFSCASTGIRARFGDATTFMAMLRGAYPMLVRPAAAFFSLPQAQSRAPANARQKVQLRGHERRRWVASYVVERQAGTGWRISGCRVVADSKNSMA
jgi:hypothetical protein